MILGIMGEITEGTNARDVGVSSPMTEIVGTTTAVMSVEDDRRIAPMDAIDGAMRIGVKHEGAVGMSVRMDVMVGRLMRDARQWGMSVVGMNTGNEQGQLGMSEEVVGMIGATGVTIGKAASEDTDGRSGATVGTIGTLAASARSVGGMAMVAQRAVAVMTAEIGRTHEDTTDEVGAQIGADGGIARSDSLAVGRSA